MLETLLRLKWYSHWMYFQKDGFESFKNGGKKIQFKDKEISIFIQDDGKISFVLDSGERCDYSPIIATTENKNPENSLVQLNHYSFITNRDQISKDMIPFFEEAGIFAISLMQRTVAFQFFAAMQNETIESIVNDLAQVVPNKPE